MLCVFRFRILPRPQRGSKYDLIWILLGTTRFSIAMSLEDKWSLAKARFFLIFCLFTGVMRVCSVYAMGCWEPLSTGHQRPLKEQTGIVTDNLVSVKKSTPWDSKNEGTGSSSFLSHVRKSVAWNKRLTQSLNLFKILQDQVRHTQQPYGSIFFEGDYLQLSANFFFSSTVNPYHQENESSLVSESSLEPVHATIRVSALRVRDSDSRAYLDYGVRPKGLSGASLALVILSFEMLFEALLKEQKIQRVNVIIEDIYQSNLVEILRTKIGFYTLRKVQSFDSYLQKVYTLKDF